MKLRFNLPSQPVMLNYLSGTGETLFLAIIKLPVLEDSKIFQVNLMYRLVISIPWSCIPKNSLAPHKYLNVYPRLIE
ncbi:Uncharacterised protein [Yersinia enterocolitica]|nr:hypothetical protein [Yersinia enterocolitica]EKN5021696.1 hypothetical protein [Yersinia enterocolitica]EKN5029289.1 hypothetical protein [Yersinia enterocolitica]EKN5067993.1 hypothetical protein [Yersinia enterocolitica]EKN5077540.1 hypothetical protein [Yersinia enterocolitica]